MVTAPRLAELQEPLDSTLRHKVWLLGMVLCRGHWSLWSLPAQLILCFCAKRTFSVSNFKQTIQLKYLSYYNNNKPHLSSLPILQANKKQLLLCTWVLSNLLQSSFLSCILRKKPCFKVGDGENSHYYFSHSKRKAHIEALGMTGREGLTAIHRLRRITVFLKNTDIQKSIPICNLTCSQSFLHLDSTERL